jgi:predicted nucleic acid-binding protein
MANKAVSNTGPILHLTEINFTKSLNIFSVVLIPEEVAKELNKNKTQIPNKIKILNLKPERKDAVKVLTNQYNLNLGESEAITLALQEKIDYFLTDDLDARTVAPIYHLEVHGTIGIILRAFRERIIDKKTAIEKIHDIHTNSSLFITNDLIEQIIRAIKEYK